MALLNSHVVLDRLEALVWLAGTHLDPERAEPDTWHEDVESARLWWRIVNREDVKATLRRLADSDEPWEAEAARAALAPSLYRP